MTGIYQIKNLANGRVYIGQAQDIGARLKAHRTQLRNGTHCNSKLLQDYQSYGEDQFAFEPIANCPREDLNRYEGLYYHELNADYNELSLPDYRKMSKAEAIQWKDYILRETVDPNPIRNHIVWLDHIPLYTEDILIALNEITDDDPAKYNCHAIRYFEQNGRVAMGIIANNE